MINKGDTKKRSIAKKEESTTIATFHDYPNAIKYTTHVGKVIVQITWPHRIVSVVS